MMEKKVLELTAKGVKIGSGLNLRLYPPIGPLRLGDTLSLDLEMELPEGMKDLEGLELSSAVGLKSLQSTFLLGPLTEGGLCHVTMDIVPEGDPGRTILEVSVKDAEYGSTLGRAAEELNLLPPVIRVRAASDRLAIDPVDGTSVELVLSRNGTDRARCDIELELYDGSGQKVPLKDHIKKGSVLKEELRSIMDIRPEAALKEGRYSLEVTVSHSGLKDRTTLRDLFMVGPVPESVHEEQDGRPGKVIRVRKLEAHPQSVAPGDTVTITLECDLPKGMEVPIRPLLRMGRGEQVLVEMPPLDNLGRSISLFVPGPDLPGGDASCELLLMDGQETLHREVRPRLLNIERTSRMDLIIRTSLGLSKGPEGPLKGLLLPAERPQRVALAGDLKVWTLSSGRHIMALRGSVLGRDGDTTEEREDARSLHLLHMLKSALSRPELVGSLVGPSDGTRHLFDALDRTAEGGRSGQGPKGSGPEGWTMAVVRSVKGEKVVRAGPGSKDGRIGKLMGVISAFFGSRADVKGPGHPTEELRELLERSVTELRKDSFRPARGDVLGALRSLGKLRAEAYGKLMRENAGERLRQGASDILTSICLERLVRLEVLTTWDDPAINAWDELRTERQRTVKAAVGTLLAVPARLGELEKAANERFDTCMRNMARRWSQAALANIEGIPGSISIFGKGGSVRERMVPLGCKAGTQPVEVRAFLRLPGRAWQLLSPPSERRGELLDLGRIVLDERGPYELYIKVRPPRSPPHEVKALLYLVPDRFSLEDEP